MEKEVLVEVLMVTFNEGIENVPNVIFSPRQDVNYIISHQITEEKYQSIPQSLLERKDVIVSQIKGRGVSKNRNNALRLATAEICICCDDDVIYKDEYFDIIINSHKIYPEYDIILFKTLLHYEQSYPKEPYEICFSTGKIHSVGGSDITFKQRAKACGVKFDERFGVGNPIVNSGEEPIFLYEMAKAGMKIFYIPEFIVEHPQIATIKNLGKYHKIRCRMTGAIDAKMHGKISLIKSILGTIKFLPSILKNNANPFKYFYYRLTGAWYLLKTEKYKYNIEEYEKKI